MPLQHMSPPQTSILLALVVDGGVPTASTVLSPVILLMSGRPVASSLPIGVGSLSMQPCLLLRISLSVLLTRSVSSLL